MWIDSFPLIFFPSSGTSLCILKTLFINWDSLWKFSTKCKNFYRFALCGKKKKMNQNVFNNIFDVTIKTSPAHHSLKSFSFIGKKKNIKKYDQQTESQTPEN